jgi:hypothetical protein
MPRTAAGGMRRFQTPSSSSAHVRETRSCAACLQAYCTLRVLKLSGYKADGRGAQVAVVQFASEARVELPLQAAETAAFQACVAEMVRDCVLCEIGLGLGYFALLLCGVHGARMLRRRHARC